jgi:glutaredoxin 3
VRKVRAKTPRPQSSKSAIQLAGSPPDVTLLEFRFPSGGDETVALVIYTKPGCPYCQQARDYYNSKGITFIDRDAQTNKEFRAEMFKYSGGDPTVPCIVQDGKFIQSGWGDPLRG